MRVNMSARIDGKPRIGANCSDPQPRAAQSSFRKRRSRKAVTVPPPLVKNAVYKSRENFGTFKVRRNNTLTFVVTLEW